MAEEQTYKFNVTMTCSGCSGAVDRALKKAVTLGSVSSYDVSLEKQEVIVHSKESLDDIKAKIAKTGKAVNSAEVVAA